MKQAEIAVKINVLRRELQWHEDLLKNKSCADCMHMDPAGWCQLSVGFQRPPPEVQEAGCQEWAWDCIPF